MRKRPKEIDVPRLCTAIQSARRTLEWYRTERREAVRQYVGRHWSDEGTRERVPVNVLALYVSIVSRSLVSRNPRVMLSTFDRSLKATVAAMEAWVNAEVERQHAGDTFGRVVHDALFSVGVSKVGLASPADASATAWRTRAGTPYLDRVSLDDFVFDVHARDVDHAAFIGHRYRVPLDAVRDDKNYSKARKDLKASTDPRHNEQGDEKTAVLGRGYHGDADDAFEDMVDLWELYLPRHRLLVTLADDEMWAGPDADAEPLRVQNWVGPDDGPYDLLGYGTVPDNPLPLSPVMNLIDLHSAVNRLYRKLINQGERQKTNTLVQGGATEDGDRILRSSDGEMLRVDNPEKVKEASTGGPNPLVFQLADHLKGLFSFLAGNLEVLGGLAPQSKTAAQDKMLNENSSRMMGDMQQATVSHVSKVLTKLCWYWHHDPFTVMRSTYSPPGVDAVAVDRTVTPQMRRRVPWNDMKLLVDPYSLTHTTPQARAAALDQLVGQILIPLMPVLQQQGVAFDVNAYLTKRGRYADMPDLPDIVSVREPPQPQGDDGGGQPPQGPGSPATTTREYVRRSLGGGQQEQGGSQLRNQLLAAGAGRGQNGTANTAGVK